MLLAEYDYDTDIAVQRQEASRIAFCFPFSNTSFVYYGTLEQGIQQGFADGAYQTKHETAAAFKKLGIDIVKIAGGTGLTVAEIEALS